MATTINTNAAPNGAATNPNSAATNPNSAATNPNGAQPNPNPAVSYDDYELEITPTEFKALGKFTRIRNDELCRMIKAAYSEVFHDLLGVNITFMNGIFGVEFYFENNQNPVPEGKIKNLINLIAPVSNSNDLFLKNQIIQHKVHGERYNINDETKALLADIMFGGKDANKVNNKKWNTNVKEVVYAIGNNDPFLRGRNNVRMLVQVTGIDFNRLLRKIFGNKMVISTETVKTESGDVADANNYSGSAFYLPIFMKSLTNDIFVMNILQFDAEQSQGFTIAETPPGYANMIGPRFF